MFWWNSWEDAFHGACIVHGAKRSLNPGRPWRRREAGGGVGGGSTCGTFSSMNSLPENVMVFEPPSCQATVTRAQSREKREGAIHHGDDLTSGMSTRVRHSRHSSLPNLARPLKGEHMKGWGRVPVEYIISKTLLQGRGQ